MLLRVCAIKIIFLFPAILGGTNYIWLKKLIRFETHIERINVELIMQKILKTLTYLGLDPAGW